MSGSLWALILAIVWTGVVLCAGFMWGWHEGRYYGVVTTLRDRLKP